MFCYVWFDSIDAVKLYGLNNPKPTKFGRQDGKWYFGI